MKPPIDQFQDNQEAKRSLGITMDLFAANGVSAALMVGIFYFIGLFPREPDHPYPWQVVIPTFLTILAVAAFLLHRKLLPHRALRFSAWFFVVMSALLVIFGVADAVDS